jgi:sulfur-carrier protein
VSVVVLRNLTGDQADVQLEASSIDQMIGTLEAAHPGMRAKLCDDSGKIRRFINVFVGEEDIRFLEGQETELRDGDSVDIVPAIAGG